MNKQVLHRHILSVDGVSTTGIAPNIQITTLPGKLCIKQKKKIILWDINTKSRQLGNCNSPYSSAGVVFSSVQGEIRHYQELLAPF